MNRWPHFEGNKATVSVSAALVLRNRVTHSVRFRRELDTRNRRRRFGSAEELICAGGVLNIYVPWESVASQLTWLIVCLRGARILPKGRCRFVVSGDL